MKRSILAVMTGVMALSMAAPSFAAEVDRRQHRQEERIKAGEKSGKINGAEANQLQSEHKAIRGQINADRRANGGHLTRGERRQVNHEQNAESRQIYNEKH